MDDQYLQQFSRHILLDEIGIEGQVRFTNSDVVIVGAGGLGSPVALYLTLAGVARLMLIDDDTVDLTNLQRQILHTQNSIGTSKVESAFSTLSKYSNHTKITPIQERLNQHNIGEYFESADLVIDCSDNFTTRYLINAHCSKHKISLLSGSAIGFVGQLALFDLRDEQSPCYSCLFPEGEDIAAHRCSTTGVYSPLTGVIGTLLASESLKFLGQFGETQSGQLITFNALSTQFRKTKIFKDKSCQNCS